MKQPILESTLGMSKWVNVDDLSEGGRLLISFEPGEKVRIKGSMFRIVRVQLVPPLLVLEPCRSWRRGDLSR